MQLTALQRMLAIAAAVAAAACSGGAPAPPAMGYDPQALPAGPAGRTIAYGHDIIVDTQHLMKGYVRANLSCQACHIAAGTKARGGSFVGTYARFPQWNKRAHRMIALQDRLAECFLYSMNGRPPGYSSKAMIAMVAYIAWLSRGTPVGAAQRKSDRFMEPLPSRSPDVEHGRALYAQKCTACHRADGNGIAGAYPPLWGSGSFNAGAGMAHVDRMTGFVRYNMPQNAPGSLTLEDAYDVSAYVLGHARPRFSRKILVAPLPQPAGFF
ncbi:MAG: c-type cytochrome [Candidatus Tumulicola sp.]